MKIRVQIAIVLLLLLNVLIISPEIQAEPEIISNQIITRNAMLLIPTGAEVEYVNCTLYFNLSSDGATAISNYGKLTLTNTSIYSTQGTTYIIRNLASGILEAEGNGISNIQSVSTIFSIGELFISGYTIQNVGDVAVDFCKTTGVIKDCNVSSGSITIAGSSNVLVDRVNVTGNWEESNIRIYWSRNVTVQNCFLEDGKDNGIRIGNSNYIYMYNNTVNKAYHEGILFENSRYIWIDGNRILQADVGIEPYDYAKDFSITRNYIEVGRAVWSAGFDSEFCSKGIFKDNTVVYVDMLDLGNSSRATAIHMDNNCSEIKFYDNVFVNFPYGIQIAPKSYRSPQVGGVNIVIRNSTLPTVRVSYSNNISFFDCEILTDPVITNSQNVTFTSSENPELPVEGWIEYEEYREIMIYENNVTGYYMFTFNSTTYNFPPTVPITVVYEMIDYLLYESPPSPEPKKLKAYFSDGNGTEIMYYYHDKVPSSSISVNVTVSGGIPPYNISLYCNDKFLGSTITFEYLWENIKLRRNRLIVIITGTVEDDIGSVCSVKPYLIIEVMED